MSKWPTVRLGEIVQAVQRPETVDPSHEYRLLGVRWYGEGLFEREVKYGHEIKANKLYRVCDGDFVYNRLFAWKGSFAVAGPESHGCHVSNEFPCFEPDRTKLDVDFLCLWFRRESSWLQALGLSTGATPTSRNRLKESEFLSLKIPLPPLSEQRRVVARIEELAAQIHEARTLRAEIEVDLHRMLSALHRRLSAKAPRRALIEVAPLCRRPVAVNLDVTYPTIAVRSFGRGSFHQSPLIGSEVTWEKPFCVKAGDILISNIKAWEGALAVVDPDDDGRVCSHRYLTCVPTRGIATSRFVCFYLLSPEGLHDIGEASPGSADRNRTLGAKALMQIPIPVPEYVDQLRFDTICGEVDALKRLQAETATELDALLPAILDRAFKGEL